MADEKTKTPGNAKTRDFVWNGPVQGTELKVGGKTVFADTLSPGKSYPLPVDHDLVKSWKSSGLITPGKPVSPKPDEDGDKTQKKGA